MFLQETKFLHMIAHVDDLLVVGCLSALKDVYHGFADASWNAMHCAGPETGN